MTDETDGLGDFLMHVEVMCARCLAGDMRGVVALSLEVDKPCVRCGRTGSKLVALKSPWGTLEVRGSFSAV